MTLTRNDERKILKYLKIENIEKISLNKIGFYIKLKKSIGIHTDSCDIVNAPCQSIRDFYILFKRHRTDFQILEDFDKEYQEYLQEIENQYEEELQRQAEEFLEDGEFFDQEDDT